MNCLQVVAAPMVGIVLAGALGCAVRGTAATVTPDLGVRYQRPAKARIAAEASSGPAGDAARVLGYPSLHDVALPEGARELRISDAESWIAGAPESVLRLVERTGREPVGQIIFVWQERPEWSIRRRATQCAPWAKGMRTCVFVAPGAAIDWPAVAARLEALGAWTIRSGCERGSVRVTDSGEMWIVRLAGARFDGYDCEAPTFRTGTAALAVYRYFHAIVRQAGSPPPG